MKKKLTAALALTFILTLVVGCMTWERATFQTLSVGKALLDQATADWNGGTIKRTPESYNLITRARDAQTTAVRAFETYAVAKVSAGQSGDVGAAKSAVIAAMASLPALFAAVQTLASDLKGKTVSGIEAEPTNLSRTFDELAATGEISALHLKPVTLRAADDFAVIAADREGGH